MHGHGKREEVVTGFCSQTAWATTSPVLWRVVVGVWELEEVMICSQQFQGLSQGLEAGSPCSDQNQKVNSSLTPHHNAYITYVTSSPRGGISPSHIITRRVRTGQ